MKSILYENMQFNITHTPYSDLIGFHETFTVSTKDIKVCMDDGFYEITPADNLKIFPYLEVDDYPSIEAIESLDFKSMNLRDINSQIIFMNAIMYNKFYTKSNPCQIDILTSNPWWIFHDLEHARHDVHGTEICCISDHVELQRIIDGNIKATNYKVKLTIEQALELYTTWNLASFSSRGDKIKFPLDELSKLVKYSDRQQLLKHIEYEEC